MDLAGYKKGEGEDPRRLIVKSNTKGQNKGMKYYLDW
jgi:hypothetical protein